MKSHLWFKISFLLVVTLVVITPTSSSGAAYASGKSQVNYQELVEQYAPVFYFHPAELFRPQAVDVIVNTARLRQQRKLWFDVTERINVSIKDLFGYRESSDYLDIWFESDGASDYKNYSAHRTFYETTLSPEAGGPPIVSYAHVVREKERGRFTIQYWLFYYYNDWFNKHEGDWEMVQVMFNDKGESEWVVLSQHHGGTRRAWSDIQIEASTHPVVYVALGSHANYFWGNETYPNGQDIGNARVEIMDRTGSSGRVIPEVILIPDRDEVANAPSRWSNLEWLAFGGHWGETALQSDFGGPLGPADKGDQWEQPYSWGMSQPLDTDTWYENRLRVEVRGEAAEGSSVILRTPNGEVLSSSETLGNVALLHNDPLTNTSIIADIEVAHGLPYSLVARWPDAGASQVTNYRFDGVSTGSSDSLEIKFTLGELPSLSVEGLAIELQPATSETEVVTWDAPELVWAVGYLSGPEVVKGVVISLLAGLLPTMFYVGALYWADQYEKEPIELLTAALLWGSLPALIVAVTIRIFFQLPVDLLGPQAIEALQFGMITPLIEETLKAVIIIFIAFRYRLEFDNVLDGIIYGAMVGFGFAMTGNIVSYLGSFLLRGFAGLSSTIFIEGVLFGLNHAFYSAIFGAGLGYARLSQNRRKRWTIPLLTFFLAVICNGMHKRAIQYSVGLNLFTVFLTLLGLFATLVVMYWSLKRQQRTLETELKGEVPIALYQILISQRLRRHSLWRALRQEGIGSWQRLRHTYQQCAEFAFKKMQYKRFPDEPGLLAEVLRLRKVVQTLVN